MIDYRYPDLVKRLNDARSWAGGITEGNRCALVVGSALNVKPKSESQSFKSLRTGVSDSARGQPFLQRFYVKAQDLANDMSTWFGPPDIRVDGNASLSAISGKQGVIFLQDCWGALSLLGITLREQTYDHIDLWDGTTLEIYKGKHSSEQINAFVKRSKAAWLWEVKKGSTI